MTIMPNADMELPYKGSKEMLFVHKVENKELFKELFETMYEKILDLKKK